MSDLNLYRVTPRQLRRMSIEVMAAGLIPFVRSSPAMGKSSVYKSIADEYSMLMLDQRVSSSTPEDFNGLPRFDENGVAYFAPFAKNFPIQGISEVPEGKTGWLLFLDEANSGTKLVQAALYKLLLDRQTGGYDLHENVMIACAGNLSTDKAIVTDFGSALDSRLIHFEMHLDYQEFLEDVAFPQQWDERVIAYWEYKGKLDTLFDFKPDYKERGERTFCAPRTWDFLQKMIKGKPVNPDNSPIYTGTITSGTAVDFVQFCQIIDKAIKVRDVLADPSGCTLPNDAATRWGVTTHLMRETTNENMKDIATYMDRMDIVFRVLYYRGLVAENPTIRAHPEFTKRAVELSRYLNQDAQPALAA